MSRISVLRPWLSVLAAILLILLPLSSCKTAPQARKPRKGCLDCHPEMAKQFQSGVIHQPLEKGRCRDCHRPHGLVGGIYLKLPTPNLCYKCHKKLAQVLNGYPAANRHQPVGQGRCKTCHDPHNAPNPGLLPKSEVELCYSCHQAEQFTRAFRHQPLEKGCRTCHDPHGGKSPGLLAQPPAGLCRRCHDYSLAAFQEKHGNYPVTDSCLDCHDPHSAANRSLLKKFVHEPVATGHCSDCHQPATSAAPFARKQESPVLCQDCHKTESLAAATPGAHPPAAKGECRKCHSPHASNHRGMTRLGATRLCLECHKFERLEIKKEEVAIKSGGSLHQPLAHDGCLECHRAHVPADGRKQLLRDQSNALCARCHPDGGEKISYPHPPAQQGECRKCHQPHESPQVGLLTANPRRLCAGCHEDIDKQMAALSLHQPFATGNCSGCHLPHGGQRKAFLVSEQQQLCSRCHQQLEEERKQANRHQPFVQGRCELCHQTHAAPEPFLLTGNGEKICLNCHGDYASGGSSRPVTHEPVAKFNCHACHNAHGSDNPGFLLQKEPEICLRCHQVNRYWEKGRSHAPAAGGECGSCHQPHFAPKAKLLDKPVRKLCAECHETDEQSFREKHNGIGPGAGNCLECHDPHGSPEPGLLLPVGHPPFLEGRCNACHNEEKP